MNTKDTTNSDLGTTSSRFIVTTYLIYIIIWEAMILGVFGYAVFGLGKSGWWMLLAVLMSSRAYKPVNWRKLLNSY
jgi:hypothetical protein